MGKLELFFLDLNKPGREGNFDFLLCKRVTSSTVSTVIKITPPKDQKLAKRAKAIKIINAGHIAIF